MASLYSSDLLRVNRKHHLLCLEESNSCMSICNSDFVLYKYKIEF